MILGMNEKTKILMVTAVWGDWHINAHLTTNLPTLMSPKNLPALAHRCDLTYRVYTHRHDVARLMMSPIMQELSSMALVEVETLAEEKLKNPIATHQWAWEQTISDAEKSGRYVLLMPPDVGWAEGSFAHVADLLEAGKKAIFMTYLRVVSDTFVPALHERRDGSTGAITVSGGDMMALALRHLHPLMAAYCHDSPYFPGHAEMVLWPVRHEGLLVRVLAREMFLYDPGHIKLTPQLLMDGNYDPREVVFINDSDKLFAVSLASIGKDAVWHTEYRKPTPLNLARWWLKYDSPSNDFIAGTHIRWHMGMLTAKSWRRQELRSDCLIRDTIAAREGMRIWQKFNAMGCHSAASILAVATGMDLLAKAFRNPSPAVIFVPSDKALKRLSEETIQNLATSGNVHHLLTFLRHHVAFETESRLSAIDRMCSGSYLELVTASGRQVMLEQSGERLTVAGVDIMGTGHRAGRYLIYQINGILDPAMAEMTQTEHARI
ncbi:MAG: hypothetical protein A3H49_01880 [Nitrospirae bacterium RIFCSPLOWO2_02_FULL_62_14]|nr:MAG: hypothetical protein A3H49_01880 [Nitrospirae bacterium RIFCSPLOWO2_02_FULL_62_14]